MKLEMIVTGTRIFGPGDSDYVVQEFVGRGTFGTVYRVQESATQKVLAVKTVSAASQNETDLATFLNEGTLAVRIRHPNVIEYEYFHDGKRHKPLPPYILMQYAEGGSLAALLLQARSTQKPFSKDSLLEMFRQLASGMQAINALIVHRDIKPANILIQQNALKITDFGLAKLVSEATRTMTFKGGGTFPYMAPEAWRDDRNTMALNVYALGMVFYELATLRHPFNINSDDPQKWMEAHLYTPVPSPDKINAAIEPKLSQIIMRMVEKNSAQRLCDWSKILELLDETEPHSQEDKRLFEKMLKRRLEHDSADQAAAAEHERRTRERDEFCKIALFQFKQAIVEPLVEFVDEFNQRYSGIGAVISAKATDLTATLQISMPSGKSISVEFDVLLEEAFQRRIRRRDDFGHEFERVETQVPHLRQRRIQGWAVIEGSDKRGINLLLVEQQGQIYGEWFMLINTSGFLSSGPERPEPFAFAFTELEQGVSLVDVLSRYQVKARPFDLTYIKEFVAEYA